MMEGRQEDEYLPGAASLIEDLDSQVCIILRDGRNLIGTLRSFDQYLNMVLENTVERIIIDGCYCDLKLGLFIVRGDNIVLYGDINEQHAAIASLQQITQDELQQKLTDNGDKKLNWDLE